MFIPGLVLYIAHLSYNFRGKCEAKLVTVPKHQTFKTCFEVQLHTFQTSPLADFTHAQDTLRNERNASVTYLGGRGLDSVCFKNG